ncbi:hypothetical protein [Rhodococcus sp. OK302]|nr:hypothetical protein [Rhodococcus sp. OK302]OYD61370.1 hypothetical protein BDB13_6348 [Rhodococcus sp. OK302]
MNANVTQLLLVLTVGIGGTAALQAALRRRGSQASRLGVHLMRPDE